MAWNEAVVTDKGLKLLTECIMGGDIEICGAAGGESCSPPLSLMALTEIKEPCHCLKIGGIKRENGSITINIRVQNTEDGGGYFLRQIGIFARLKGAEDDVNQVLFAVIQDENGEEVPTPAENPEFLSEFDFVVPVSNADKINAAVDPSILVTAEELNGACDEINERFSAIDSEIGALDKKAENNFNAFSAHKNDKAVHISASDKAKLDGIDDNANNYSLPLASESARGGVRTGYSANGKNYPVQLSGEKMFVNVPWTDTKYGNMAAASASAAGKAGLVPAPAAGAQTKYLRGDGTWQTPPDTNTTYAAATQSANGLMSAADKKKLDGIAAGANAYSHPTSAGNKHIPSGGASGQILRWSSSGTAVWGADNNTTYSNMTAATASAAGKAGLVPAPAAGAQTKYLRGDGTWQTPPDTNTTYAAATQSANGLMSAADKKKLDGIAAGANAYFHPTSAGNKHIPSGGSSGQILRWSADGTAAWGNDNNTTYSNMMPATASTAGKAGLVPAPAAGKQTSFLRGDGAWVVPTNTTYNAATQSVNGLMSAADKKKLDNIDDLIFSYVDLLINNKNSIYPEVKALTLTEHQLLAGDTGSNVSFNDDYRGISMSCSRTLDKTTSNLHIACFFGKISFSDYIQEGYKHLRVHAAKLIGPPVGSYTAKFLISTKTDITNPDTDSGVVYSKDLSTIGPLDRVLKDTVSSDTISVDISKLTGSYYLGLWAVPEYYTPVQNAYVYYGSAVMKDFDLLKY